MSIKYEWDKNYIVLMSNWSQITKYPGFKNNTKTNSILKTDKIKTVELN